MMLEKTSAFEKLIANFEEELQIKEETFAKTVGELQKETIVHVFAMRAVLTPAQAKVFDDRIGEALTEERQ